ncbi:hypothetical protein Tco_0310124, partial [Tanacetum coccineum]
VNKANQFTPRPVQLNNVRPNLSTASNTIKTGRVNVNTGNGSVNSGSVHVNAAEILKKFDLVNVKAAITPMETKMPLTKDEEASLM